MCRACVAADGRRPGNADDAITDVRRAMIQGRCDSIAAVHGRAFAAFDYSFHRRGECAYLE
ncbi:hypothetical protein WS71_05620 [Burkholderia mayonis]|uniref:Uncharacterized protein n=1 Tax=Burkholderia mayonis TaxID=1385591 RepID=A0A1B4FT43_9BURK|nr:hypothetical protein WS71_05620 [Burkholderia mayonis]KVE57628.1 hypothetical protein WS71_26200 [Burkholderia mayonis]